MTWHAKRTGAYYMGEQEADDNAREALYILQTYYGWTFAACCGMFGNIDFEGQWNPWRWESDHLLTKQQAIDAYIPSGWRYSPGYGLIGWTPARRYQINDATDPASGTVFFPNYDQENYPGYGPNWSDINGRPTDGEAQIRLIGEAMSRGSGNIWVRRKPCSSSQFITLTDPREAAYYWLWNAEYPQNPQQQENRRMQHAYDWYQHLGGSGSGFPLPILFKRAIDYSKGIL